MYNNSIIVFHAINLFIWMLLISLAKNALYSATHAHWINKQEKLLAMLAPPNQCISLTTKHNSVIISVIFNFYAKMMNIPILFLNINKAIIIVYQIASL
jgi:membrane-associated phospholipid phosphatase